DDIFLDDVINGLVNGINRTKRYVTKNGAIIWIDIHSSAIKATDGTPIFILSQIIDVTLKRIADNEILKLNRLYHFISTANEYLLRADDKKMLFEESCRIAVELGGVSMAWAGVIDENNQVDAFASYGNNEGFLENTQMSTLDDLAISNGPTGLAVRTKTYSFSNDIENDPAMAPWRKEALQRGYKGSISYPIIINKKVKATFTIYVSEVNYFNETEIKLLKELVDNISFTLEKIEIKEKQQISELDLIESEEKFRILVEQVMIGVYILQDEKFVYVNPGFEEISGYSYNELIGRMSFDDLIHEDDIGIISNYNRVVASKQKKFQHVLRAIHATGELRHIEIVVAGITYNNKAAFIGSIIDITSRVEEDKRINQAIIDAQEKERLQIGMELNDNVKQILGAAIL
ncbi:MAG: PAS domain S-box protein, partial [Ferruginibacter sp.]